MTPNRKLIESVELEDLQQIKEALAEGANVHTQEDYVLYRASLNGYFEIVQILLEAGADIHACNDEALYWAARSNHFRVVKLLLKAGANVYAGDSRALRWAEKRSYTKVVKLLEDHIEYLKTQPKKPVHPILYNYSKKG